MAYFWRKISDKQLEKKYRTALRQAKGSREVAARIVGHSHTTFQKYLHQFKLVKKRKRPLIRYDGRTQSLSQWSCELEIPYPVLLKRLNTMTVQEAFTLPYEQRKAA